MTWSTRAVVAAARLRVRRRGGARRRLGRVDGPGQRRAGAGARARRFTPRPRPELIASPEEVAGGPPCLLNALAPDVFRGETNRYGRADASRARSTSSPSTCSTEHGRLLPEDELREQLGAVGALGGGRVVAYCGAGISATLDAFALTPARRARRGALRRIDGGVGRLPCAPARRGVIAAAAGQVTDMGGERCRSHASHRLQVLRFHTTIYR